VKTLDWIIVAFLVLMAVWGYLQGFVVSAFSLAGFAIGAFAGSRLAPLLLDQGASSPYAPLFTFVTALMAGGLVAVLLETAGEGIRRRLLFTGAAVIDGVGGAVLVAALGIALVWIGGAVALHTPGASRFRKDIQRSLILSKLNRTLPPSGPILHALARVDPFPSIAAPQAEVPPPTRRIVRDADVRAARDSVVKILGSACGLSVEGSGWTASDGVVVTNAHVVAGQDDTSVESADGTAHSATALAFDVHNDIAVLRVEGLSSPPLPRRGGGQAGEAVAILGYPHNGPYRATPGRLGKTITVLSEDAYGQGPIKRRMTQLRGKIESGNSGGPVVDAAGRVVATVFAATVGGERGGFGVPAGIVASVLRNARAPVDTGPCVR
jgi:hypothetical protein